MILEDVIGGSGGVELVLSGVLGNRIKHPDYSTNDISFGIVNNRYTSGTTARNDHSAVYYNDGVDDLMVVFGGNDSSGELNTTWEYNISTANLTLNNPKMLIAIGVTE